MLSIIITFCDKDFKYLNDLIESIKQKVKIPYEIILVDNRKENKEIIQNKESYKILVFENKTNFSRYKAVFSASGKKIWFIDVDDEIFEIDETFSKYLNYEEKIINFSVYDYINKFYYLSDVGMWNKWLDTKTCQEEFKKFKDYEIRNNDDSLMLSALKKYENIIIIPKKIYIYRRDRGNFSYKRKENVDFFKHLLLGLEHLEEELKLIDCENEIKYFIFRNFCLIENLSDSKETEIKVYNWIFKSFSKQYILDAIKLFTGDKKTQYEADLAKKIITYYCKYNNK